MQEHKRVPIGRLSPNTTALIVDPSSGAPLPLPSSSHIHGELWVGGPAIAQGYLGKPELTQARRVCVSFLRKRRA